MILYGLHRLTSTLRIARAAQDGPALRQGIDLAFQVTFRAEWFAAIKIGAPVPLAVPAVLLDVLLQLPRLSHATIGKGAFVTLARQYGKLHQHVVKEKRQPDTFASTFLSDQIHSVIPVAAPDERQA